MGTPYVRTTRDGANVWERPVSRCWETNIASTGKEQGAFAPVVSTASPMRCIKPPAVRQLHGGTVAQRPKVRKGKSVVGRRRQDGIACAGSDQPIWDRDQDAGDPLHGASRDNRLGQATVGFSAMTM
jgi:hypothetical protein